MGRDTLIGNHGGDTFLYADIAESTGPVFDKVKDADFTEDRFDVAFAVNGIDAQIASGELRAKHFDADLAAAADGAHLDAHHAVLFTPDAGGLAGETLLIADANGTAGYQAGEDLVVQLASAQDLASLGAEDFI